MNIALFHLPNLTLDQQDLLLSLSDVGNPKFVKHGETTQLDRLRHITLERLTNNGFNVFTFAEQLEDESEEDYIIRVRPAGNQALVDLVTGTIDAMGMTESSFTGRLQKQLEWQAL